MHRRRESIERTNFGLWQPRLVRSNVGRESLELVLGSSTGEIELLLLPAKGSTTPLSIDGQNAQCWDMNCHTLEESLRERSSEHAYVKLGRNQKIVWVDCRRNVYEATEGMCIQFIQQSSLRWEAP